MIPYLAAFAVAAGVSLLAVPLVMRFAHQRGLLDPRTERKNHVAEVPRIGGLGILLGLVAGALVGFRLTDGLPLTPGFLGIMAGALVMFAGGLADDLLHDRRTGRLGLPAVAKLAFQVGAAIIPVACGVSIKSVRIPGDGYWIPEPWLDACLTMLWLVAVANAVNWIDGLDGLAGGVSAIMAGTLALLALGKQPVAAGEAIAALALLGGITGFLRLNLPPARIYMGDGGAMLIGYLVAALSVSGVMKSATAIAVGAPMLILALPIVNLTQVVVGRVVRGQSPMQADRTHLQDRLQDAGWSGHSAVLFCYAIAGLCGSAALCLMELSSQAASVSLGTAALLVYVAARRPRAEATPAG